MIKDPQYFLNDTRYKGVIIEGSTFKDAPYKWDLKVTYNKYILNEFIPAVHGLFPNITKGHYLLMLTHAQVEGFYPGSRSYENNNPGNIGNTDGGQNHPFETMDDGIIALHDFILRVIAGKLASYPMGKPKFIKDTYSKEIARNVIKYQKSPWVPGYRFIFTGQIDQYFKCYATGPRSGNVYINTCLTIYKMNGFSISPESKIQDLIKLN